MGWQRNEQRFQSVCLLLLTVIAVGAALYWLRPIVVPFVLALFITLALMPPVDTVVRRLHVPRALAAALVLLLFTVSVLVLGAFVVRSMADFTAHLGEYQKQAEKLLTELLARLPLEQLGIDPQLHLEFGSLVPSGTVRTALLGMTNTVLDLFSLILLVIIFVGFLLVGGAGKRRYTGVAAQVERGVRRYIITKAILSAATGFLVFLLLNMLGVRYAVTFGAFAFLLNFIPSLGSIIATLLPIPVVLLSPEATLAHVLLVVLLPGSVQFTIGNIIEPKVMGTAMELHPVMVLMSLIFWGMLWGFEGMLLAVPLTAITKIVFTRIEVTRPVAELMAGKIAPTEAEQQKEG